MLTANTFLPRISFRLGISRIVIFAAAFPVSGDQYAKTSLALLASAPTRRLGSPPMGDRGWLANYPFEWLERTYPLAERNKGKVPHCLLYIICKKG